MRTKDLAAMLVAVAAMLAGVRGAHATFHAMQVEYLIGSVDGDMTKQAIQLRMRMAGQNLVSQAKLQVRDAAGNNPILLLNIGTNLPNGSTGDRVLICSSGFQALTSPVMVPDYLMTSVIPASYFAAGSLTFESDGGVIYWRLSWGGSGYTGSHSGDAFNDDNTPGNFGPAFASSLPSTGRQALHYKGTAGSKSTNNAADYEIASAPITFTNNARNSFVLPAGCTAPSVTDHPDNAAVQGLSPAVFTVTATGTATLTFQWRKNGGNLSNGPDFTGVDTPTLTVTSANYGIDEGTYDCVVTNGCGSATCNGATLTIFCRADFNNDGVLDAFDYDDYVSAYFDFVNNGNGFPDYNTDGTVDAFDYDDFVSEYFVGC